MKTNLGTWIKHFENMRAESDGEIPQAGTAAWAALEGLMPGMRDMWYDVQDLESRVRELESRLERLESG